MYENWVFSMMFRTFDVQGITRCIFETYYYCEAFKNMFGEIVNNFQIVSKKFQNFSYLKLKFQLPR